MVSLNLYLSTPLILLPRCPYLPALPTLILAPLSNFHSSFCSFLLRLLTLGYMPLSKDPFVISITYCIDLPYWCQLPFEFCVFFLYCSYWSFRVKHRACPTAGINPIGWVFDLKRHCMLFPFPSLNSPPIVSLEYLSDLPWKQKWQPE